MYHPRRTAPVDPTLDTKKLRMLAADLNDLNSRLLTRNLELHTEIDQLKMQLKDAQDRLALNEQEKSQSQTTALTANSINPVIEKVLTATFEKQPNKETKNNTSHISLVVESPASHPIVRFSPFMAKISHSNGMTQPQQQALASWNKIMAKYRQSIYQHPNRQSRYIKISFKELFESFRSTLGHHKETYLANHAKFCMIYDDEHQSSVHGQAMLKEVTPLLGDKFFAEYAELKCENPSHEDVEAFFHVSLLVALNDLNKMKDVCFSPSEFNSEKAKMQFLYDAVAIYDQYFGKLNHAESSICSHLMSYIKSNIDKCVFRAG